MGMMGRKLPHLQAGTIAAAVVSGFGREGGWFGLLDGHTVQASRVYSMGVVWRAFLPYSVLTHAVGVAVALLAVLPPGMRLLARCGCSQPHWGRHRLLMVAVEAGVWLVRAVCRYACTGGFGSEICVHGKQALNAGCFSRPAARSEACCGDARC